jgi:hypothetical protein
MIAEARKRATRESTASISKSERDEILGNKTPNKQSTRK